MKSKQGTKRKVKEEEEDELNALRSPQKKASKRAKKPSSKTKQTKRKTDILEISDDEDQVPKDQVPKPITVYLFIESSTPPAASSTKSRGKSATSSSLKTIQRAPFIHNSNEDFSAFCRAIAKNTPCHLDTINTTKLQWRFETPQNGQRKLVTNQIGYEAMISAAKLKKGGAVIFVYMPPPAKPEIVSV
jgi:hypothetical protein